MRNPWRVQIQELEQPLQRSVFPSKKRAKAFCEEWVGKFGERSALLYSVKKKAFIARYTFDGAPRWEAITGSSGSPQLLRRKPAAADPHIPFGASKTTADEELMLLFSPSAEESTGSGKPSIDMTYTKWRRSRKLSRASAALAMVLYAHARNRKWEGTIEEIAALSLFSENAARAALLDLRRRGMIRRIKAPGKPTIYEMSDPHSVPAPADALATIRLRPWAVCAYAVGQRIQRYQFQHKSEAERFCRNWVGQLSTRSALLYDRKQKKPVSSFFFDGRPRRSIRAEKFNLFLQRHLSAARAGIVAK